MTGASGPLVYVIKGVIAILYRRMWVIDENIDDNTYDGVASDFYIKSKIKIVSQQLRKKCMHYAPAL